MHNDFNKVSNNNNFMYVIKLFKKSFTRYEILIENLFSKRKSISVYMMLLASHIVQETYD